MGACSAKPSFVIEEHVNHISTQSRVKIPAVVNALLLHGNFNPAQREALISIRTMCNEIENSADNIRKAI